MNKERRKDIGHARGLLEEAMRILTDAETEEREYFDSMSEGMQSSEKGEKASEAADALQTAIDEIESAMGNIETAISE